MDFADNDVTAWRINRSVNKVLAAFNKGVDLLVLDEKKGQAGRTPWWLGGSAETGNLERTCSFSDQSGRHPAQIRSMIPDCAQCQSQYGTDYLPLAPHLRVLSPSPCTLLLYEVPPKVSPVYK